MRQQIGKRLRLIRENIGITQADLGKKLGIQFQHVSKYERGETVPTWENLIKLNDLFDININWLLTGKGKMFISPITYSNNNKGAMEFVKDIQADSQLDEILEELRNDHDLKTLVYDYIKNYRQLRITTSRLKNKVNQMKQKL